VLIHKIPTGTPERAPAENARFAKESYEILMQIQWLLNFEIVEME
jgi:hypothetical protein